MVRLNVEESAVPDIKSEVGFVPWKRALIMPVSNISGVAFLEF